MDVKRIFRLLDIMKAEDLDEIEVKRLFSSIRLVKHRLPAGNGQTAVDPEPAVASLPDAGEKDDVVPEAPAAVAGEGPAAEDIPASEDSEDSNYQQIVSPMVGTFYTAPGPGVDSFVKPGQHVEIGQTVCIIEAMKLMNEIESDKSGKIVKILVKDSQPVEFGQPLFLVEPA